MLKFNRERHTKREVAKELYRISSFQRSKNKVLLFVVGCQRSGTTMLMRAFALDWQTKVYGETGLSGEDKWKLAPPSTITGALARQRAALHVVKPLCDSQNVPTYLDQLCQSKALWLYRDYRSVARSNLAKWGFEEAKRNLRPFVTGAVDSHWASQGATPETIATVQQHFAEAMAPNDAAALFWYVRNKLYFDTNLVKHPRARLYNYETLVKHPVTILRSIYAFVEQPYPGDQIVQHIHAESLTKGQSFPLSPAIDALCAGLMQRLDALYAMTDPAQVAGKVIVG
jgi:hypothetical protein